MMNNSRINQDDLEYYLEICTNANDNPDQLSEWEQEFVLDMRRRLAFYKTKALVSVKQRSILERIANKL